MVAATLLDRRRRGCCRPVRWTTPRTSPCSGARPAVRPAAAISRLQTGRRTVGELEAAALQRYPRSVSLEERFTGLLPEVTLGVDAARFAEIAAAGLAPRPAPAVGLAHLHVPKVSVPAQARLVMAMLLDDPGAWFSFRRSSPPAITRTR